MSPTHGSSVRAGKLAAPLIVQLEARQPRTGDLSGGSGARRLPRGPHLRVVWRHGQSHGRSDLSFLSPSVRVQGYATPIVSKRCGATRRTSSTLSSIASTAASMTQLELFDQYRVAYATRQQSERLTVRRQYRAATADTRAARWF